MRYYSEACIVWGYQADNDMLDVIDKNNGDSELRVFRRWNCDKGIFGIVVKRDQHTNKTPGEKIDSTSLEEAVDIAKDKLEAIKQEAHQRKTYLDEVMTSSDSALDLQSCMTVQSINHFYQNNEPDSYLIANAWD